MEMSVVENQEWKSFELKRTGTRHEEMSLECQDCMKYRRKEHLHVIVLADAVSHDNICVAGVNELLDKVCDLLLDDKEYIMDLGKEEIALKVYAEVIQKLNELAGKYDVDRETFASTLLFIFYDEKEENYLAFHLGDGVILTQDENDFYHIVSYPTNGFFCNETYLTTSELAFNKIKIKKRKADCIKGFWLCSDGVYRCMELGADVLGAYVKEAEESGRFGIKCQDDQGLITLRRK